MPMDPHDYPDQSRAAAFEETKHKLSDAYGRSQEAIRSNWQSMMNYSRQNPERFALIAFAAGICTGMFFSAMAPRRTPAERMTQRIADPLFLIARDYVRRNY